MTNENILWKLRRYGSSRLMRLDNNPLENSASLDNNLFSKDTCNIESYTTNSCRHNIINSQVVNIVEINKQLHDWSIPCMKTKEIYL